MHPVGFIITIYHDARSPERQITTITKSVQFIVLHSERNLQQTSIFLLLYACMYSNYISIGLMLFISSGMRQIRKDKVGKAQEEEQTNAERVLVRKPEGRSH